MTPAARVAAAIEILDRIGAGAAAEQALTSWARSSRFAGSGDRAAIRDHVFDVLRQRSSCRALGGGTGGRAEMLGLLRGAGADADAIFTGDRYAPAALTEAERDGGGVPLSDEALNLPPWLIPVLRDQYGEALPSIATNLSKRAPVFLRVNLQKTSVEAAIAGLARDGIEARSIGETALLVENGARKIRNAPAYKDGLVELQDARSQLAVSGLPLQDNMKVLDYCAGGGGKSLAMAARSNATFFAHDALPDRMRDLPVRAKRAGAKIQVLDATKLGNHAPFDLVLCDVPCSGSGTWRRTPAAKWDFTAEKLQELEATQAAILDKAAELVGDKGCLAYATCSILQSENQKSVQGFLDRYSGWSGFHQEAWLPDDSGDGFFIAHLTRD